MTITDRTRVAFADVQRFLGTGLYFHVERDDTARSDDGKPALLLVAETARGDDDPLAFAIQVNEALHIEQYGVHISGDQIRANVLHETLHALRLPADRLGEYRLRYAERVAHSVAQETAVYAEERAFAPLVNCWFAPLHRRLWYAVTGRPPKGQTR